MFICTMLFNPSSVNSFVFIILVLVTILCQFSNSTMHCHVNRAEVSLIEKCILQLLWLLNLSIDTFQAFYSTSFSEHKSCYHHRAFHFSAGTGNFYEMCSFPESKIEKYSNKQYGQKLLLFNRTQLSRVYPKGQRIDSSNYDPMPMWNTGCHMLAINYQTPDRTMQLNAGRFKVVQVNSYSAKFLKIHLKMEWVDLLTLL